MFIGNVENADVLFNQARELAPQCSYVFAMSASFELASNRVGAAIELIKQACARASKKTGALCYTIKARVLDAQRDKIGKVEALKKALEFDPADVILSHQYGVALSRAGFPQEAINQFTRIIDAEKTKVPLRSTLLLSLKTRIINLRRLGRLQEANQDLVFAKEVLSQNPHLQDHANDIADLEEE
ncbi:MAG: hypothetical protein ACRD98_09555 [Nitrososphaera sp.]